MEDNKFDLSEHDTMDLNTSYILNKIDDLLIFRYYLGGSFKLGRAFKSPFRVDKKPSFSIFLSQKFLKLLYKDHTTGETGDCFDMVMKIYHLTLRDAIMKIATDFGIIKGSIPLVSKQQIEEARAFKDQFQQEYLIQIDIRKMTERELDYWRQFNITGVDLKKNKIYGIKTAWINKKEIFFRPGLHFAYHFPDIDKFKIYSPDSQEFKWFGNVSTHKMEGLANPNFDFTKPVIVTKSRKDRIILSKLYVNVCSCQNESESAIPPEKDEFLSQFPEKYCWFDSDDPGKEANKKLNKRGYKWINVPNDLYEKHGLTDPGDVIRHFGWEEGSKILINELKKKGLL